MDIIFAIDSKSGYAKNGSIPWKNREDLSHFKYLTLNNIVIMGRITWESLPIKPLPHRINIVISNTLKNEEECLIFNNLEDSLKFCKNYPNKKIFVIGGADLIYTALRHPLFNNMYLTLLDDNYECDKFLDNIPFDRLFLIDTHTIIDGIINKYTGNFYNYGEDNYLNLGKEILLKGDKRLTRNGYTLSLFGKQLEFDLSEGFPLLTTKKMFFRGIVEELLFFISGNTDTKFLENKGINIWKGNTNKEFLEQLNLNYKEGWMGPMYGYQWRFFNKPYNRFSLTKGIDQLENLIKEIKTNPSSRRLLLTAYNPIQVDEGVLYPCHSIIIQFYILDNKISCKMYQRSADYFLGLPFNIASTSLLLLIIAKECNLIPDKVILTFGDIHIYEEHIPQVEKQIKRFPFIFPTINIKNDKKFDKYSFEDFELKNYNSYDTLRGVFKA